MRYKSLENILKSPDGTAPGEVSPRRVCNIAWRSRPSLQSLQVAWSTIRMLRARTRTSSSTSKPLTPTTTYYALQFCLWLLEAELGLRKRLHEIGGR